MKAELDSCYSQCQECTKKRISRPQKQNEINMMNLFENYFPGSRVQIDFAEKANDDFLVLCDQMSGLMQIYKCRNKSTEIEGVECNLWFSHDPRCRFWTKF